MRRNYFWFTFLLVLVLTVLSPDSAWAAPGGKIISTLFKSAWGKMFLGALCVVLAPYIIHVLVREHFAVRRTLKHLKRLAAVDPHFDWLKLKDRVTDCYHRVHSAWHAEDMSEASEWMTSWYWQNQQLAFLNQWERDGLVNHCRVRSIGKIRPLYLHFNQDAHGASNGSRVVISITANMEDYLSERATNNIVAGKTGYRDIEHVWTLELKGGKWVVANIEEDSMTLSYVKLRSVVPAVLPANTTGRLAV